MEKLNSKNIIKLFRSSESSISMVLGIIVIVVVGMLLFRYFKNTSLLKQPTTVTNEENIKADKTEEENLKNQVTEKQVESTKISVPENISLPATYEVQKNDSLWKISKKFYGTGYAWIKISQANKISNPNLLFTGTKLTIPEIRTEATGQTGAQTQIKSLDPITGNSYTVVKGDNLWKISVRAYQDGFKWPEIAKVNRLVNPSIIHPGNVLTIPR